MIPLLQNKRWGYAIIRSVTEGTSSVQNIITITMVILVVSGDVILHMVFPGLSGLCTGLVICMMAVHSWPQQWCALCGATVLGVINYQAGGEALLAGTLIMEIIQYAKMRMVDTDFSRRVLVLGGYSALEITHYMLISMASAEAMFWRLALATILLFLYTIKAG